MRSLRYAVDVTLDGCGDHRAVPADEDLHRHATETLARVVHPRVAGHGPTLFAGLSRPLALTLVSRSELASGAVALRYEPMR